MSKGMVELYDRLLKLADNAESLKIEAQAKGYPAFNQGLWHGYEQAYRSRSRPELLAHGRSIITAA